MAGTAANQTEYSIMFREFLQKEPKLISVDANTRSHATVQSGDLQRQAAAGCHT